MHVAVFADIEGAFGIWRMRQCRMGTREWQYGRHCLTEDVNAVVAGAFDGGADRVTIKDTHEVGFNCLIDRLDKRAAYRGGHFISPTFFGPLADVDLVLYVAIHAASGTPDAFFAHTHYGIFAELKVNGRPACEMDIYGGYLGEHGLPIGMVSGEDVAVAQALETLPWVKSVEVDKKPGDVLQRPGEPGVFEARPEEPPRAGRGSGPGSRYDEAAGRARPAGVRGRVSQSETGRPVQHLGFRAGGTRGEVAGGQHDRGLQPAEQADLFSSEPVSFPSFDFFQPEEIFSYQEFVLRPGARPRGRGHGSELISGYTSIDALRPMAPFPK